ncbi:MAG: hypothetical protein Kow00121_10610 [Elainellaceae cyanobacterium]
MLEFLKTVFSPESFVPHGHCYLWKTGLVGLHFTTDALIALAYYSISIALFYFVWQRQDLPFKGIFLLFGAFIISCGTTHLLELWTLWHPTYWLAGGVKAFTALISVFTAIEMVPLIPQALALPNPTQLQQLNDDLQASQARFAGILDIASDAIISIDTNQHITLFNRAAEKVFGYTAEEILGQSLDQLLPQRFAALHQQHISNFRERNGNTRRMGDRSEIFGRRKDGTEFAAEASISRLEVAGERVFTAFLRDITDRKQAEAKLQEQQEFLRQVIDINPNLIFVKDWDGRFILANQAVANIYNTTVEDLINKTDADFSFNLAEAQQYRQADRQVMQTLQPLLDLEETVTTLSGAVRCLQTTKKPLLSADGQARYVLGVANDITALKQTEAALQQKTEELETFFSSTIDLLCIANIEGYFLRLNPEWEQTLGYSLLELEGQSFFNFVHPDDVESTAMALAQLVQQQSVQSFVNRYRHQDGSYRWIEWRSVPKGNLIFGTARDITHRKQAEAELRLSQEQLKLALEASGEGLWDWQMDTGEVYRSYRYLEILGYNDAELPEHVKSWEKSIHPDDKLRVFDLLNAHIQDSSVQFACEYRMQTKLGEWKWITDYGKVVSWDEQGKPLRMIGTHKDISDRKQAEAALRLTDFSFESSSTSAAWIKPDASIMRVNAAACQTLGYSREELQAMHVYDLDPNFPVERWTDHWQNLKQQKHLNFITQQCTKDGRLIPVEVTLNYVEFDGEEYNFASMQNISDRLQAEAGLRESEERFRSAFDYSAIGMALVSLDGYWLKVNSALCEIVGYSPEELASLTFQELTHPDDLEAALAHFHQLLAGEIRSYQMEKRYIHKQGQAVWILLTGSLVRNSQNEPLYVIGQIQDISDRKRVEVALQESEQFLQDIINSAAEAIWVVEQLEDGEFWIISMNPSIETTTGIASHQWIGKRLDELWNSETVAQIRSRYYQCMQQNATITYEEELPFTDYSRWFLTTLTPLHNGGSRVRLLGTSMDISDRKRAEEKLRQSENTKRAMIQAIPDLLIRIRDDGTQLELLNQGYVRLLANKNGLEGITIFDVLPFYIASERLRCIKQALRTGEVQFHEYQLTIDGQNYFEEARIVPLQANEVLIMVRDITDRKQMEQALRESEIRFRTLIEDLQVGVIVQDIQAEVLLCNSKALDLLGLTEAQLLGKTSFDPDWNTIHEDGSPFPGEDYPFVQAIATGRSVRNVIMGVYCPQPRDYMWLLVDAEPRLDSEGKVQQVICTFNDISDRQAALRERERTEALLRQSEERLRLALKAAKFGTWEYNLITGELFQNDISEIYGLLPGQTHKSYPEWEAQIHPDDRNWIQAEFERAIQAVGEFSFEFRIVRPDGTVRWTLSAGTVVHNQAGRPIYAYGIAADITDRKLAEVEQKAQQAFLRQVIDTVPNIIFVKNKAGRILIVNQAGADAHGTTVEAMLGKRETDFNPNFSGEQLKEFLAINQQVMQTRRPHINFSQTIVNAAGETHWYQTVINPLIDVHGQVIGIVGATTDVTDLKQIQQALQQAKEAAEAANRAKSIFLANMSHELRTPLNVILGFAQVMHRDPLLTPEQRENLHIIRRSGDHLLNLINDVLDLSKIEAGRITLDESSIDFIDLLRSLEQMFRQRAETKGLQLHLELAPTLPQFVTIDANKLRQILINLLSNAIKFTKQGHVTLRVRVVEAERETEPKEPQHPLPSTQHPSPITQHPNSSIPLRFEVSDTGIGIAPNELENIFSAFVQTQAGKVSPDGTGLGLTISRKFVQLMGGNITVQSTLGHGSTFSFAISVTLAQSANTATPPSRAQIIGLAPNQPNYRILIVDDQPENRRLLVRLLTQLGLNVREAANGQEAVTQWQQWQPHLIYMDIRMPLLNGYEATQQIRATPNGQAPIIIALTAQASRSDRTLALASGCNDYLSKPFQEEVLFSKMADYLGLKYLCATEQPNTPDQATPNPALTLHPSDLFVMPPDWIAELRQAAQLCDDSSIEHLIEQIPTEQASLIQGLRQLTQTYSFKQIIGLTKSGATDGHVQKNDASD